MHLILGARKLWRRLKSAFRNVFMSCWYTLFANEAILILGDSRAGIFDYFSLRLRSFRKKIIMNHVQGATASGLQNPGSKTQAHKKFVEGLKREVFQRVFIVLGEVDTGYVIWYRVDKYKSTVDEMFELAVKKYKELIDTASDFGLVTVFSTPLPTIRDDNDWGEVANLRKTITATQKQRTELTVRFNEEIKKFCDAKGYSYISLDNESLGSDGVVKKELLNEDPLNHHYSDSAYMNLLSPHLKSLFSGIDSKSERTV